ncbi:tetratricopeptide repeat protein [Marinicellulosiphila megalodicopiae]|uniref:tetratricopeptide repeat protein n=1 Tax=Marinicellulosiphila megalodicopiae TaxID=2724896 RepID=UPI003BAE6CD3
MLNEHDFKQTIKIAMNELSTEQFESALNTLKNIENENIAKNNEIFLGLLSSVYSSLQLFDTAREYLEKILMINADNHLARFQIGMTHFQQNNLDQAKQYWLPILSYEKDFTTHFYFSFIEEAQGNKSKALELIQIAKQRCEPNHPIYQQIMNRETSLV